MSGRFDAWAWGRVVVVEKDFEVSEPRERTKSLSSRMQSKPRPSLLDSCDVMEEDEEEELEENNRLSLEDLEPLEEILRRRRRPSLSLIEESDAEDREDEEDEHKGVCSLETLCPSCTT